MCVFHLNFSRLDVKLRAQELGTDKRKLNAKCLTAHLTNCAWERLSPLSALSSDEHQFRVPAGPKPLEEQKGHMDCFFPLSLVSQIPTQAAVQMTGVCQDLTF